MNLPVKQTTTVAQFTDDDRDEVRKTLCPNLSEKEFGLFWAIVRRTGADPFRRQIYAIKYGSYPMSIVMGIDYFRAIAHANGLAGIDEPRFFGERKVKIESTDKMGHLKEIAAPERATVTVYRHGPNGSRDPYTATAYWDSYYPGPGKQGKMWRKFPQLMLAKCAEALAERMGFSQLSGIYVAEEMHQAEHQQPAGRITQQPPANEHDTVRKEVIQLLAEWKKRTGKNDADPRAVITEMSGLESVGNPASLKELIAARDGFKAWFAKDMEDNGGCSDEPEDVVWEELPSQ